QTTVDVAVALRCVGFDRHGLPVQELVCVGRGFVTEALHRLARIDDLWRIDADQTDAVYRPVASELDVDHLAINPAHTARPSGCSLCCGRACANQRKQQELNESQSHGL